MTRHRFSVRSLGRDGPWWAAAVAIATMLGIAAPTPVEAAEDGAEPVASVGDLVLSRADLERMERRLAFFGALDGVRPDRRRARAVRRLVEESLLTAEAERRGIEVDERVIDDRLATLVQQLSARNQSLDRMFAATGLDRDSLRGQVRRDLAAELLISGLVTPEELQQVEEARRREFDGTRCRVSHIVLRPDGAGEASSLLPEVKRIRNAIMAGDISFDAAAARHSAAPSRRRGGDIGFIPRHGQLAEEFARAAFSLEKGGVSEPVVSPFGVHLITVTEIDPGTAGPDMVRPHLERIAAERVLARLLEECRDRTPVTLAPGVEMEAPPDAAIDGH